MELFRGCLALVLTVGWFGASVAQPLGGRVIDEQGLPVGRAAVKLVAMPDSAILAQAMTDEAGTFSIPAVGSRPGILVVSHLGYRTYRSQPLAVGLVSVGTIVLHTDVTQLAAVSVLGRRPSVTHQVDRMTIDVEGSALTVGNSVLELLERTPGVTSNGEGNFAIQGRQGVQVMINGRATYISGAQLALLLRGMQARDVVKVELMSSPSARQNAEGSGGIINIVTKTNRRSGLGGDAFMRGGHGRRPEYALGGGMNLKTDKWAFQASGSHGRDEEEESSFNERRFGGGPAPSTITRQWEDSRLDPGRNYGLQADVEYAADSSQVFGAGVHWIKGRYQSFADAMMHVLEGGVTRMQQNVTQNRFDEGYNNLTFNARYTRRFDAEGHELTANADYAPHGNDFRNGFHTIYHDGSGQQVGNPAARTNVQDLSNTTYVGSIDYVRPLGAQRKLELGWRATYLWIANAVRNDTLRNGIQWDVDDRTSNRFRYGQHVQAAYGIFSGKWGELEYQAGLRMEYTGTEAEQVTIHSSTRNQYVDLFPNAFLGYPLTEKQKLRLAYSRRIKRPGDHDLNAFRVYADPFNYFEGNPQLAPSKTHALELVHVFDNKFFTTLTLNRSGDAIVSITGPGARVGETLSRPENVGSFTNYGISVLYSARLTGWWEVNQYANLFHNRYEGSSRGATLDNHATSWSANSRHTFQAYRIRMELLGYYHSGMVAGALHTASRYGVDVGIDRSLLADKANVKLACTGLVRNARPQSTASFGSLYTVSDERPDNRRVVLSITYRFGE